MLPETRPPVEYATKADLRELRQEMRADLAEFKLDVLKQIAELQKDLHRLVIQMMIAMTAIFGGLVTILKLFS
jgi:hypothetical protein